MTALEPLEVAVEGGSLRALRWGSGAQVCVALHGITANAASWTAVGERLPQDWSLVAVDMRGRGHSRELGAPYDAERLAADAAAVVRATGARVLAGHSLGAYVAVGVERDFPGLVERLVLLDGGLALPVPPDVDPDAALAATLGPALDRLSHVFADEESYVDTFRAHPALGPYWTEAIEAYARYDALPTDGGVRARAVLEAVRVSGRELLTRGAEIDAAVHGLTVPARLLCVERGLQDQPGGLLPVDVVEAAAAAQPMLEVSTVPDTNHYTIAFAPHAVDAVVDAITRD
ncbi:alpha/beta hydrolase [Marmoricola endophyticus]|uniref:Alpha/beta hydrolase n=1 Tax=Marmoricola endophyticus TaxID=2040280 RepID=A0A917BRK4_9ACTN|nr:alpha/beta hydrolase [Marmoricola endophyticus]GGF56142.1 alpha/beta hydrolase [Marmoricola endophyticus]